MKGLFSLSEGAVVKLVVKGAGFNPEVDGEVDLSLLLLPDEERDAEAAAYAQKIGYECL